MVLHRVQTLAQERTMILGFAIWRMVVMWHATLLSLKSYLSTA